MRPLLFSLALYLTSLVEINREKEIAWTSDHSLAAGAHHLQILTTNGKPEPGMPLK